MTRNYLQYYTPKTIFDVPTSSDYVAFTDPATDYDCEGFTQTLTPIPSHNPSPQVNGATAAMESSPIDVDDSISTSDLADLFSPDILGSPEGGDRVVAASTAFHPTAHPELPPVDTILCSSDGVLFYVHSSTILSTCGSAFNAFLSSPLDDPKFRDALIPVASTAGELNIILHMLYRMSSASYSPTLEMLANAVDRMPAYSITPCEYILPGTPLYDLLLSYAPLRPLDVYALAAHHNVHHLAVITSSHLLSYPLQNITDSQADRMGAVYLKKLMTLHVDRFNALKSALLKTPLPHPPTRYCNFAAQKKLTRVWSLVIADLAWDARPDISAHSIQAALDPLLIQLHCESCQKSLRDRIKDLVVRWTDVSRTI